MGCSQSKIVTEKVEMRSSNTAKETLKKDITVKIVPKVMGGASLNESQRSFKSNKSTSSKITYQEKNLSTSVSFVGLDTMDEYRREEGSLITNCIPFETPLGRAIEEVYDGVHDGEVLGSGISGVVRLATHKATGLEYAVKCLDLGLIESDSGLEQLRDEIYIMCQLDHPNIIRLEEVYESHREIFLVQEYCQGKDLFERLDEQPDLHYNEAQCANLVKQMLSAVRYLHSKGIIHRDLKLENFLFASKSPDSELKMIDFGLSKHFKFGEVQHDSVGTPYTVAPEVIKGSYDARCDIWGIGVITYLLLSGDPPFGRCGSQESEQTVRNKILTGYYHYEPEYIWEDVSEQAKDFIKALLMTDPANRPDAEGAQHLPWIEEFSQKNNGLVSKLNPNVVGSLVAFKEYSDMRKLLCEVLSFALLPDQIKSLRKEFEVLDQEGTGEISLQSLKTVLKSSAEAGSLGALSETEIEDIFNAMRVRETETTIHWHEFIAAGLSQCHVDDRNLRLAFDRMDMEHKGYITFKNVLNLLGSDGASEERVKRLYFDGLEDSQITGLQITYEHFLALMKGQSTTDLPISSQKPKKSNVMRISLDVVPEILHDSSSPIVSQDEKVDPESGEMENMPLTTAPAVPSNVRRTLNLPEHNHDDENIIELLNDESKTPLVVNKNLYRAHRQMRQAVLDASKRLEEAQIQHLMREEEQKPLSAGLVMRRGRREQMPTEKVRNILNERMRKQQVQLAQANKKAGRVRRRRKKTVSDISGMIGDDVPDKLSPINNGVTGNSCPPSPAFRSKSDHPIFFEDSSNLSARLPFLPLIQINDEKKGRTNIGVH